MNASTRTRGVMRPLLFALGVALVGLGIVGAALPVMPSTFFFILAAACFARSSPKFEAWILDRPGVGPAVRAWRERRAIARPAKIASTLGMGLGAGALVLATPSWAARFAGLLLLAACAAFVWTRPD